MIDRKVYTNHMSDKISKYKIIVETVDRPLKEMRDQLKAVTQAFKDQQDMMLKNVGAMGNLANMYKKFEIGKLAVSELSAALTNIFNEGLMNSNKELENDVLQLCVDKNKWQESLLWKK